MRIFVIGDIHGALRALVQLIQALKLMPKDRLIFLGDYVDGWSESAQVIDYLIGLSEEQDCVFIKGNHDVWCQNWLENSVADSVWLEHGGKGAVESYATLSKAKKTRHLNFFKAMYYYYIDTENRLFVHAGFKSVTGVKTEVNRTNFYFDRSLWETALSLENGIKNNTVILPERLPNYSEIFIGHTPTVNYKQNLPMRALNVWNIDTGAAFKGRLSAIEVNSKKVTQTDFVYLLYPKEMGRNKA